MNRAIFLDRDGTLIEDVPYPHRREHLRLREDLIPHLKWAKSRGFKLIVASNQSGIARGLFTVQQYEAFQTMVEEELARKGVVLDGAYYCPYHKDGMLEPWNCDSIDRKPGPGMFLRAKEDFNLDLSQSFMIGDNFSDRIALPELQCYILKSRYTADKPDEIFADFDAIFKEIMDAVHTDNYGTDCPGMDPKGKDAPFTGADREN